MLRKLIHAATRPKTCFTTTTATATEEEGSSSSSSALRIIHAGGIVEQYYMAIPAARIIDKYYPAFTLTRPDFFRRPWDDVVVRPEEMLIPGQKYFLVPRRTVKKLKRRIDKQSEIINSAILFKSVEKMGNNTRQRENEFTYCSSDKGKTNSSIMVKLKNKTRVRNRRVRFFGIDTYIQNLGSSSSEHSITSADSIGKGPSLQNDARKRRTGNLIQWEPSLTSITENHDIDE